MCYYKLDVTIVTKPITGNKYLYYQQNVKVGNKNKVITTYIGRKDLSGQELIEAKQLALLSHSIKLFKATSLIKNVNYNSERAKINNDVFEYMKVLYGIVVNSMPPQEIRAYEQDVFVKYVHGTTSIEGNPLSLGETRTVLIDNLTPPNKTVDEINTVHNYKRAKEYLDGYKGDMNLSLIKTIHKLIMNNIVENDILIETDNFRTTNDRGILSVKHPKHEQIESELRDLNEWYEDNVKNNLHPIEIASVYHHKFEKIHPFFEGNGRVGRALLDLILKRHGFPSIYITKNERSSYLNALQEGDHENYEPLINFIAGRISWTITRVFIKSDLYRFIKSEEFRCFFGNLTETGMYQTFMQQLNIIEESED
jgi:fido (protein-threonine AMPylation protein)